MPGFFIFVDMKNLNRVTLLVLMMIASSVMAQKSKIEMYKTFGGVRYLRGDSILTDPQMSMILYKDNPAAYAEFKKAKKYNVISSVMGFTGGALVAVPLITAVAGGEPEWLLAAGGGALILGSIPFNRIYKARSLNAIDIYNEKLTSRIKTNLYFTGSRAGIVVKF
ncbi:MAG: hypothetical protein DI538_04190 [Azospira oryzae]|jgi:hypothetical protein|nr:MAG: hypothetical protein DI538_04190 [Azospira oryzae]